MNIVEDGSKRIGHDKIKKTVAQIARNAGMPEVKADILADLLVKNDLMGVFSHGSMQIATYARIMRDGLINPDPQVHVVRSDDTTILIDGDGGLGYFAASMAADEIVSMCKKNGIAAVVTRNHGHIGAAGIYARSVVKHDLIAYVTSGHQLALDPKDSIMRAAGGSPMSFAVPSGNECPMVLDFGTMHDLYAGSPHVDELFKLAPGIVFRSMGLGFMCQALGGFLAGVPFDEKRAVRKYKGADQGSLIIALDIGRFMAVDDFKTQMDEYIKTAGKMKPMPGYDIATLPGVLESEREKNWTIKGIPVSQEFEKILLKSADEFGVQAAF